MTGKGAAFAESAAQKRTMRVADLRVNCILRFVEDRLSMVR
jgi:hypothetical protein